MEATIEQALAKLKGNKQLKPIYLLTGEDNYLIDKISEYFENNVVEESLRDFDQKVVYGRDVTWADVAALARQIPMLSPFKLVVVKEAQDIEIRKTGDDDGKEKKVGDTTAPLVNYLNSPSPQTVVVICYRYKKLDKRTQLYKAIEKTGEIFEHKNLYESNVAHWIAEYVNEKGFSITESCAHLIAETAGSDRTKLVNELDKMMQAMTQKSTVINEDVIEQYLSISREFNVFDLQRAIGQRNMTQCSRIINYFVANPKAAPIQMIIPVLYRYIVNVMIYIQNSSAISGYAARDYEVASKNYTLPRLALAVRYLHEADLRSKGVGGNISDGELLKELVFKITH